MKPISIFHRNFSLRYAAKRIHFRAATASTSVRLAMKRQFGIAASSEKLDINSATQEQLDALPGHWRSLFQKDH